MFFLSLTEYPGIKNGRVIYQHYASQVKYFFSNEKIEFLTTQTKHF